MIELLKILPLIMKLAIELARMIKSEQDDYQRKERRIELKAAIEKARNEKDTSELERFFSKRVRSSDVSPSE